MAKSFCGCEFVSAPNVIAHSSSVRTAIADSVIAARSAVIEPGDISGVVRIEDTNRAPKADRIIATGNALTGNAAPAPA